jgi:hypothetical protein
MKPMAGTGCEHQAENQIIDLPANVTAYAYCMQA